MPRYAAWLSVLCPTVCVMAEKRATHLRVVRTPSTPARTPDVARADYWAELQSLRDERRRLRAG